LNRSLCSLQCGDRLNGTGRHAQVPQARATICLQLRQRKKTIRSPPNLIDTTSPLSLKNKRRDGKLKYAGTSKTSLLMLQKTPMSLHGGRYVFHAQVFMLLSPFFY
jgi:hypothetical protein